MKPKKNPNQEYPCPTGPTPLMLAVLCEQDEIVRYILEEKKPDLSVRAGSYTAFHLSIMTKDHACFDLLLRTEYYQANIDMEITLDGIPHEEGWKTTALHSSITQKNYYCAYYLLHNPLPPIEFFSHSESNEEGEGEKSESAEKHIQVANINQISCSGSTPLRIAVFIHDVRMVCLLYKIGKPNPYLPKSNIEEAKSDKTTALGNAIDSLSKPNLKPEARNDFEQIKKILEGDYSIVESTANKVLESCGIKEKESGSL